MRVLVFSSYYLPGFKGGGPIKTIKNLFEQIGNTIDFRLITSDRDLGDSCPYKNVDYESWNEVGNAKVFYNKTGISGYKLILKILLNKDYDFIYLNSFFSPQFSIFPLIIAKFLSQQTLIAPRGEFSKGALSIKSRKKKLFITLFKTLRLHDGPIFQASTKYEADDIREALGGLIDIQIAENIATQVFVESIESRNNDLKLVFISRISPKKNLLTALEILRNVKNPITYHIYGPVEDHDYWSKCKEVMSQLPVHINVEYKGEINPIDVIKTISKYDVFFLPTIGENYGHVIAEALCAGLPLVISDTTPWRNLEKLGVGRDLPLDNLKAFSVAIDELALMSPEKYHQMRESVLAWAKNKFSQRDAVEANLAMFKYAANK